MQENATTIWSAIILAAGKGTRLGGTSAKVLREVAGRPMIDWVIDASRGADVANTVVVVGFDRESVEAALPSDAVTVFQDEQLGTGHAVMQAKDLFADKQGDVFVLYGDMPAIRSSDLTKIAELHKNTNSACTLLTMELPDSSRYGRVLRNEDGSVSRIVEYADATEAERSVRELNSGIYAFDIKSLFELLPSVDNSNAQGEIYLTDVVKLMIENGLVVSAVKSDSPQRCIGGDTPEAVAAIDSLLKNS